MKGSKQPRLSHKFAVLQHSYKKRKNSLEARAVLLVFWLELEISRVTVQEIHRKSKKAACSEDFLFFNFRTYCYSAKASEAVVKIATDEKDEDRYKCSLCVIVWLATVYQ